MWFQFNENVHNLLFYGWSTHNTAGFAGTCVAVFGLAFVLESVKVVGHYLRIQAERSPLSAPPRSGHQRPRHLDPLAIPASVNRINRQRFAYKLLGMVTYVLNLLLGYFVMLFVMTYNTWFLISAAGGYGLGYLVFGAYDVIPMTSLDQSAADLDSSQVTADTPIATITDSPLGGNGPS